MVVNPHAGSFLNCWVASDTGWLFPLSSNNLPAILRYEKFVPGLEKGGFKDWRLSADGDIFIVVLCLAYSNRFDSQLDG